MGFCPAPKASRASSTPANPNNMEKPSRMRRLMNAERVVFFILVKLQNGAGDRLLEPRQSRACKHLCFRV